MLERDFRMSAEEWAAWFAARGHGDLSLLLFAIWDPIDDRRSRACSSLRHQDLPEGAALEAFLFDDVQLQMLS